MRVRFPPFAPERDDVQHWCALRALKPAMARLDPEARLPPDAPFDYWLGRDSFKVEESDRYRYGVPCLGRRIRRQVYETSWRRFDSFSGRQLLSLVDRASRLRSVTMPFDSARERRRRVKRHYTLGSYPETPRFNPSGLHPVTTQGATRPS